MSNLPAQFSDVSVVTKANVYFGGSVVSHTVLFAGNIKKTLGIIHPGTYHFNTGSPERMEIVAGACRVTVDGVPGARDFAAGATFDVPGRGGFTVEVASGLCEYICSFLE